MQPCEQADNINNINHSLGRIEDALLEQTALIRSVADQNARIGSLERHEEAYQGIFTEIYNRLRVVELFKQEQPNIVKLEIADSLKPLKNKDDMLERRIDRALTFIGHITSKPALIVFGILLALVILGTICDFVYHRTLLGEVYHFVRGN